MPKFLVAIHHPDNYDPFASEDAAMEKTIDELNDAMVAAGVRVYVGGLHHASTAVSLVGQPDGSVEVSEGAYLKTDEHVAGLWVLEVGSQEEAIEWGRKAAIACKAPVEVRQFHG